MRSTASVDFCKETAFPASSDCAHYPNAPGQEPRWTDIVWRLSVSSFEIRGYRHVDCCHDASDVLEHGVAVEHSSVGNSARPSDARTRRGDGLETNLLQDPGGARIPSVGEHEAGTSVQGQEGGGLVGGHAATLALARDLPPDSGAYSSPRLTRKSAWAGHGARVASAAAVSCCNTSPSNSRINIGPSSLIGVSRNIPRVESRDVV